MEQNKFVVHNHGLSKILFSSQWSLRSIFKHLLVIAYVTLITLMVFKFNSFKNALGDVVDSGSLSKIFETLPQIAWYLILVFMELLLLKISVRMLQLANRNTFVFVPFALMGVGIGVFVVMFLPQWMTSKILDAKGVLNMLKIVVKYSYIFFALPGFWAIWLLLNAMNERRISPYIARANIIDAVNLFIWTAAFGLAYLLAKIIVLGPKINFNYKDELQMFLIIITALLFIVSSFTSWKIKKNMKKRTNFKYFDKNVVQSMTVTMIMPIAIWLSWTSLHGKTHWVEWLLMAVVIMCVLIALTYSFIRKTEAGSPKIFMVIISLMLVIIWMAKYFFEYFWNFSVNSAMTMPIALIGTAGLMLIVYFKSPMVSNRISFLFLKFTQTIWTVVLISWALQIVPPDLINLFFPPAKEVLGLMLLSMPVFALVVTMVYWYATQWKIKTYSVMKIRSMSESQMEEEQNKNNKMNKYRDQKMRIRKLKINKANIKKNKRKGVLNV